VVLFTLVVPADVRDSVVDVYVPSVKGFQDFAKAVMSLRVRTRKRLEMPHATHLARAPGYRLLKFAHFFFSSKTVNLTFGPLVADWHSEYFEALNEQCYWRARMVSVRYIWAFAKAAGLSKLFDLLKRRK
jgi:hypothetical protein